MYGRFMPSQLSAPDAEYGVAGGTSRRRTEDVRGKATYQQDTRTGGQQGGKAGGKSDGKTGGKSATASAAGKKAESSAQKALGTASQAAAARRAAQQRAAEARAAATAARDAAVRAQMQRNKAAADAANAAADAAKAAENAAKAAEAAARAAEEQARKDAEQAERDRRAAAEQDRKDAEKAEEQRRKDAEKAEEQRRKDAEKAEDQRRKDAEKADGKASGVSDDTKKRAYNAVAMLSKILPGGRWEGVSASKPSRRYGVAVGRGAAMIRVWEDGKEVAAVASDRDPVAFLKYAEDVYYSIRKDMKPRAETKKDETGSGAGASTGSGGGASTTTVSWAGAPYLMEIAALVGWTGASSTVYGISYAVREVTLDGIAAPAIDVVTASGTKTVTPNMPEWFSTATEVITAKASGVAAAAPGAQGATTVTQQQISGQDYLPTGEGMDYPSEPSGGRDEADRLPSSGEMIEAPEGQGVMAFVTRNKWWILGGAAAYVLAHRSNPATFPLPDALSKMVK